jgi:hypothetical protein
LEIGHDGHVLKPAWQLATPMGDAECHLFDPGGPDDVSRFLCSIDATGEFWWFTQREVRRNTNLTWANQADTFPCRPDEAFRARARRRRSL